MRGSRLLRWGALGVAVALSAGACSLGEKEDWAEAARGTPEAARQAGAARTVVTLSIQPIEQSGTQEQEPIFSELEGVTDFASSRTELRVMAPKERRKTRMLFEDLLVYLPRSEAAEGEEGWGRFDFTFEPEDDEIGVGDRRFAIGLPAIAPDLAVELLEGMLTGSIEQQAEAAEAGGATAAHYMGKVSTDSATRDIEDEDRRQGILRLVEIMGVTDDLVESEVWVSDDGLPRRVVYRLPQRLDRNNLFEVTMDIEFSDYGAVETDIALPDPTDTVEYPRFREFMLDHLREAV